MSTSSAASYASGACQLRVSWQESSTDTSYSITPILQRYDKYDVSPGGTFSLYTAIHGTSVSGQITDRSFTSGSGWRNQGNISKTTFSKTHSTQQLDVQVITNDWFDTIGDGGWTRIGSISKTWSVTIPKKTSYSVKYNANGGSSTPSTQTKWHGESLTLAAAISHANASAGSRTVTLNHNYTGSTNASKTSTGTTKYTFSKWNTAKAGSGTAYSAKGSYTKNAATTLYAQWSTSTSWSAVTLTTPTRSGYAFVGWATSSTATAKNYAGGASYTPGASITLYAIWNRTVTYNANGGSGAPSSQTSVSKKAITLSSSEPMRTGYRFTGWNTKADGTGTSYAKGGTYATDNPSVTLYAQWQVLVSMSVDSTLRYASGGSGENVFGGKLRVEFSWTGALTDQTEFTGVLTEVGSSTQIGTDTFTGTGASGQGGILDYTGVLPDKAYTLAISASGVAQTFAIPASAYTKPRITSMTAIRLDSSGDLSDDGEYLGLLMSWSVYDGSGQTTPTLAVSATDKSGSTVSGIVNPTLSGKSAMNAVYQCSSSAIMSTDEQYTVSVTLTDGMGASYAATATDVVSNAYFAMDVLGDAYWDAQTQTGQRPGHGISFGAPCKEEGFHVAMDADFSNDFSIGGDGGISGDLSIGGNATVTGATNARGIYQVLSGDFSTSPSTQEYHDVIQDHDSEGNQVGYMQISNAPSYMYRSLAVKNPRANNKVLGIYLQVNDDGTLHPTMTGGAAWPIGNGGTGATDAAGARNALGANSSGIWPQSLGGTGASDLFKTLSATGAWGGNMAAGATKNVTVTFSVPSGYTIAAIRRVSAGRAGAAIAGFYISGSTVVVAINNPTSSSLSSTNVTVDVLCLPS